MNAAEAPGNYPFVQTGPEIYDELKRAAAASPLKRARKCLHPDDDALLHEMLIVFHRDTIVHPHRHSVSSESHHLIFGEVDIVLFDDAGHQEHVVHMGELGGRSRIFRLNSPVWHTVLVRSEYAAVHEVKGGPFRPGTAELAPWAPAEPAALREYLATLDSSSVQHART